MGFTETNGWKIVGENPVFIWQEFSTLGEGISLGSSAIYLQVGMGAQKSSQIQFSVDFYLGDIDMLRNIGLDSVQSQQRSAQNDYIASIDLMLNTISAKQVEYGSAQNRIESALDEISTQYENLVSSRSTIRDADISEVSATYIQQQILQQAAATLMSTANQSPAIALQLI